MARKLPGLGDRSARAGEAGIAAGPRKVSCILIHRRRTCHRGRRWRREHSDHDRHQTSGDTGEAHIEPCFVPRCAENSNPPAGDADPRSRPRGQAGKACTRSIVAAPSRSSTWRSRSANGGYSSELTAGATVGIWWAVVIGLALGAWPRSRVPGAAVGAGASPCRAGGLDGDLDRLGERRRRRLRRGRPGARLPGVVRAGGDRVPSSERPHVAGRPRAGPRGRRRPGASPAASSRRSAATRSSGRSCRRPPAGSAIRSATGTASPRRWPIGRPAAGLAGRPRPGRLAASGRGGRDPVADPGHLLRLLARGRDGRRGRARGPAGARPGARPDARGRLSMGGAGGVLLASLASRKHELVDAPG